MCVFKDYSNLEKLGPVRSARHYYVQMANMLGGIYAHVGWSVYAESWIKDTGLNNLNGLYDSTTFIVMSQGLHHTTVIQTAKS